MMCLKDKLTDGQPSEKPEEIIPEAETEDDEDVLTF
jgi:hypothetical protein